MATPRLDDSVPDFFRVFFFGFFFSFRCWCSSLRRRSMAGRQKDQSPDSRPIRVFKGQRGTHRQPFCGKTGPICKRALKYGATPTNQKPPFSKRLHNESTSQIRGTNDRSQRNTAPRQPIRNRHFQDVCIMRVRVKSGAPMVDRSEIRDRSNQSEATILKTSS